MKGLKHIIATLSTIVNTLFTMDAMPMSAVLIRNKQQQIKKKSPYHYL